jgi:hypothetical protein
MTMKKFLLLTIMFLNSYILFSQNLTNYEREALSNYEYIGEIDYLLSSESTGIKTGYKWDVHLYGKPFGNTYIFKILVRGKEVNRKTIYTLSKNGDKYTKKGEFDRRTYDVVFKKVDISNYNYKTRVSFDNGGDILMYLNLPF